jgi:Glycosyl transferase family 90
MITWIAAISFLSEPQWMIEQINKDLKPFEKELSCRSIDALFEEQGDKKVLTRVRVKNGAMQLEYSNTSKTHCVTPWIVEGLQKLSALCVLPDLDFVFTSADSIYENASIWPIFAESKEGDLVAGILIPDRWALKAYAQEKKEMIEGNEKHPWENKISLLFFRGSDTCRQVGMQKEWDHWSEYDPEDWTSWDSCPRVRLARLSLKRPDLIDARFWKSLHNLGKIEEARKQGLIVDEFFPLKEHPRFKYLIDFDGYCASCPRTAAIFHSNSVVFKEVTPSKQWWYGSLQPFVHYIPVSGDLSDLITQLQWAKKHDAECKEISENARALVADVLSEERIYQYLYQLLLAYAEKQSALYDR